ncbi:MAG: hypothetical protein H6738_21310 [Alphaproteobacteria bacterium]|nr:hypothetical protein [Alphaproteobacteria bacterium]
MGVGLLVAAVLWGMSATTKVLEIRTKEAIVLGCVGATLALWDLVPTTSRAMSRSWRIVVVSTAVLVATTQAVQPVIEQTLWHCYDYGFCRWFG